MHIKSILVVLIISAIYLHETDASPKLGLIKAKIAVAKGKLALATAPHFISKAIVFKEVKTKTKIAAAKAVAAAKAAKVAAVSALTAPIKIFKTKFAIKAAGLKFLKALKIAKIAKTVAILKNLVKSPIIVPVPVPLPIVKALPGLPGLPSLPFPFGGPSATASAVAVAPAAAAAATEAPNQLDGFLTTATKALQAAGASLPLISAFRNNFESKEEVKVVTPSPVYRFVPEVGFTNYNRVSYQPRLEVEVPAPINYAAYPVAPLVSVAHIAPVVPATPVIPAETYGPPAETYGPPPANVYGVPN